MFHIVLDIDHTLLETCMGDYSKVDDKRLLPDKVVEIQGSKWSVWYRPYLRYFLECLRTSNIILSVSFFSMGTKTYCETLINELIPVKRRSGTFPYRVFTREDAEELNISDRIVLTKNVRKVFWESNDLGANANNTLIIDDNLTPHFMHPFNVIRVKPFSIESKRRMIVDTTLKDIFDVLCKYRSMRLPYFLPPCKCMYTRLYNQDREMDESTVCFQCALKLTVKPRPLQVVVDLYKKWSSSIDWKNTLTREKPVNQTKIDASDVGKS